MQSINFSIRTKNEILKAQLKNERTSFEPQWRDLSDNIAARRSRWYTSDVNKGERRNLKILDSTATFAQRTLRSGMMSGVTSPARPWFKLGMADPALEEINDVKTYLHNVAQIMSTAFLRSNLYNTLPTVYGDMGTFSTGAMFMDEEDDDPFRFYSLPIGSYYIGSSNGHSVDIYFREFQMTVRNIVEKFGKKTPDGKIEWDNISQYVQSAWENHQREAWVAVSHVIKPNDNYKIDSLLSKHKKYSSVYYEDGAGGNTTGSFTGSSLSTDDKILREKGYNYFPVLVPRWETTGEDWYGSDCPGMTALGDIKQLQLGEKRIAQGIEKMIYPSMQGPSSLKNSKATILPGDVTFVDDFGGGGFRPSHEVRIDVNALEFKQEQIRARINKSYFVDLFLMLASSDRRQITAREIDERHDEKLLALGPVLEQINQDLLDPLIDNAFLIMNERGMFPDPPEQIQGEDLKVEYVSLMAQAQKLIGIGSVERFVGFAGNIAQADPLAAKKIDTMKLIDTYADLVSVPPGIVKSSEQVKEEMQAEQAAAQAAEERLQVQEGISSAGELAQMKTGEPNALTDMLEDVAPGDIVNG